MKSISFFNNKGGVGKTTTLVNLAGYLAKRKSKKVLVLDMDPQSNSTQAILPEETWEEFYGKNASRKTIYNFFHDIQMGGITFPEFEIPVNASENNYDVSLIPGHPKMSMVDDCMAKSWSDLRGATPGGFIQQNWLKVLIKKVEHDYDYLLIDMGPALGALNRSVLLNSDYFITPMASDIFSLIGISNIGEWIKNWKAVYARALDSFSADNPEIFKSTISDYLINTTPDNSTKFLGYSIQQYSKRKFKDGERPVKAYENVIKEFHSEVVSSLGGIAKEGLQDSKLKIGDIPYVYSIIPLSQVSKTPIFELAYNNGIRGNQTSSVSEYTDYMEHLTENFFANIGE